MRTARHSGKYPVQESERPEQGAEADIVPTNVVCVDKEIVIRYLSLIHFPLQSLSVREVYAPSVTYALF
jgi:hypothetical protein